MTTRVSSSVLANTAVTPGVYGGNTNSAIITVDQQGRITSAANVEIVIPPPGGGYVMQTFNAPATWTKPEGLKAVKVTVIGGGGVARAGAPASPTFTAAGTSSFGAFLSATGGANSPTVFTVALGGTGSGGDLNVSGGDYFTTGPSVAVYGPDGPVYNAQAGVSIAGRGAFGFSVDTSVAAQAARIAGKSYGGGALFSSLASNSEFYNQGAGGGGGGSIEFIPAPTIPGPVSVTVGAGGTTGGPAPLAPERSPNGGPGVVIVEEFY